MSTIVIPYFPNISDFAAAINRTPTGQSTISGQETRNDGSHNQWKPILPSGNLTPINLPTSPVKEVSNSVSDISENGFQTSGATDFDNSHSFPSSLPNTTAAIDHLSASIQEKFLLTDPAVIMLVCSEDNPHLELTSYELARNLVANNLGKVLLIDACQNRKLSSLLQLGQCEGLSNLLADARGLGQLIEPLVGSSLDFLPAGTSHWEHWGGERTLRYIVSELKRTYQFILVAAGESSKTSSKLWSSIADGGYLLVSLKNSHPAIAASAVSELQTSGARILGCVVTDAGNG